MGFKAGPVLDWAKFSIGSCTALTGNTTVKLETYFLPFGSSLVWREQGGMASLELLSAVLGTRGANEGAGGAHVGWCMRMEKSAYQAALQWPKPYGCFHHTAESDPHKELREALQSEVLQSPPATHRGEYCCS